MKNSTFKWLWRVTGKKKRCVALLILAQGINGCSGVLYALLLQQMVDRAVGHDRNGFLLFAGLLLLLVAGQIAIRGLIRWLEELSRATLEICLRAGCSTICYIRTMRPSTLCTPASG